MNKSRRSLFDPCREKQIQTWKRPNTFLFLRGLGMSYFNHQLFVIHFRSSRNPLGRQKAKAGASCFLHFCHPISTSGLFYNMNQQTRAGFVHCLCPVPSSDVFCHRLGPSGVSIPEMLKNTVFLSPVNLRSVRIELMTLGL